MSEQEAIIRRSQSGLSSQTQESGLYDDLLEQHVILQLPQKKFTVARLNEYGDIIETEEKSAPYYREDLEDGVYLDMMYIPGGWFKMGSPEDEEGRLAREGPLHPVSISAFQMGQVPVTQSQWRQLAKEPKVEIDLQPAPSQFKGDNSPVERVNWYEAVEFCTRLRQMTGRDYRLPSEAEWEYACRGGTRTPFYFGKTISTDVASYQGTLPYHNGQVSGESHTETTKVGIFPANNFGLKDMHGNVGEWCQDRWHDNYEGAPTNGEAWEIGKNEERVLRGGSFFDLPKSCRSASRHLWDNPSHRSFHTGFRLVLSLPKTA